MFSPLTKPQRCYCSDTLEKTSFPTAPIPGPTCTPKGKAVSSFFYLQPCKLAFDNHSFPHHLINMAPTHNT